MCQKECENNDKCNGICYPRYNVLDETNCYLCFGDEFIDVPEHLVEAEMEFKKRTQTHLNSPPVKSDKRFWYRKKLIQIVFKILVVEF